MSSKVKVPSLVLNNGLSMPIFGLGTWQGSMQSKESGEMTRAICEAIDVGYRHFDCAHCYGNEDEIGEALKTKIDQGVVTREELFITSKLWNTYHRPDLVIPACKKTLKNLGLEYLDLYLIHWPMAFKEGDEIEPKDEKGQIIYSNVDFVDTWPQMEECVRLGLTKSIGISNFNSQQIERVLKIAKIPPVTNQVECHPYLSQQKLKDFCAQRRITITAYSPLGAPYRDTIKPEDPKLLEDPKIKAIAAKYGKSTAQILIRYMVDRGIAVIPKSSNTKRMLENMDVFDFQLLQEDINAINSLDRNLRYIQYGKGHPHYGFDIEF